MFKYSPPSQALGLQIVYQDDDLLILDKPSGLLSVPGRGEDKQDCLLSRVLEEFPSALIIHRLDMSTSGLIMMALTESMQVAMGHLFQRREIEKYYTAVVAGELAELSGMVNLPLITDWPNRPRQKVDHESGKPSMTEYQVLNYDEVKGQSRMRLKPLTGRSHQLRVHMLELGHPIVGDDLYAPEAIRSASPRLLLHALELRFKHPLSGLDLRIECLADPESFQ